MDNVRLSHLSTHERASLFKLLWDFSDIFFLKDAGDNLETSVIKDQFEIVTKPCLRQAAKIYRTPEAFRKEVETQVTDLLHHNIIKPWKSPWNAPVHVVPKKMDADSIQKWRVFIDYRQLNQQMIDDKYTIPRIEDILDRLSHATSFTTLDLASGFHQVPIREADQEKTAFSTYFGHYHFTRMPFGLKNAPLGLPAYYQ